MHRSSPVALLSAGAALLAAGLHLALFRHGSLNNDEVAYLLQARAIAAGRLFLDPGVPAEAHRTWFFVERPEGLVSKYLPLVSAVQAVGLRLFGSVVPVLALLAALVPPVVVRLAREVGLDRRAALAATALVSLSPVVVMQSALPLSYVLFLLLVSTGWLLTLRIGLGRAGPWTAAVLGLGAVAAACARPYDTVLLLGPALLWAAWQRRSDLLRLLPALAVGAAPLVAVVLAYNTKATGSALTLPFGLMEPRDALGYGPRRLAPEDALEQFGPLQGLHGLLVHFGLGPLSWFALGGLLLPAAVVAWRRSGPPVRVLLVCAAVQLVGYAAFWGPWNFSVLWGRGTRVLGPIYAVALLVPVVLAGLPVLRDWLRRSVQLRRLAVVSAAVCLAQLGWAVVQSALDVRRTDTVLAVAERGRVDGVVRLDVDPPYLGHPVSGLVDGTTLAGQAPVPPTGAPVPDLLQLPKAVYGFGELTYVRSEQRRVEGATLALSVSLVDRSADVLVVERAGRATACALLPAVAVTLTPTGTTGCDTAPVPAGWPRNTARRCADTSCVVFAVYRRDDSGDLRR
ncbi:MAG TPA: hypothetical protein VFR07_17410, partial [Mycobacteriales bacterium]|nr:hypothetical protein [Mycobacteriales bacterium]